MPAYLTQEYKDYSELLDAMETNVTAVKAFNALLETASRAGDDMNDDGYGVWCLLNLQVKSLEGIASALRDEFAALKSSKLEIRNSERIAEWAGVSQFVVNRVISIATGIDLGPPTERHTDKPPYVLRESANASA